MTEGSEGWAGWLPPDSPDFQIQIFSREASSSLDIFDPQGALRDDNSNSLRVWRLFEPARMGDDRVARRDPETGR